MSQRAEFAKNPQQRPKVAMIGVYVIPPDRFAGSEGPAMTDAAIDSRDNGREPLIARLAIGFTQGVALYLLFSFLSGGGDPDNFARYHLRDTLRYVALFAPLPILFGVGNLPARKLAAWSLIAALAIFAFGWFATAPAWRGAPPTSWLFILIVVFILHEFVQAAHDDRRRIASYETYFERSWRHGFQAALSLGFVAAFWLVISLGAMLFQLIGIEAAPRIIYSDKFRWISSAVAFALGVHLTDADAGLTRGARQIGLALLSWLAILMTAILAAFLAALPFAGLETLWDTKRATVLLLNAAATMILLINAAYQAGDPPRSAFLRGVVRFSALPLAIIVGLAGLGLWLRVDQYGFTPARVLAAAELLIVTVYAAGYLAAAVKPGVWLSLIRPVNIGAALFVAAILSALMTPVLDPARVSVVDQVARLDRGAVEPDDFDFGFLNDQRSGRWGQAALKKLAARSGSERDARIALLAQNPVTPAYYGAGEQTFSDRRKAIILLGGGEIPDAALLATSSDDAISSCVQAMQNFEAAVTMEEERERQRQRLGRRLTERESEPFDATPQNEDDPDQGRCPARLLDADFDGDDDLVVLGRMPWSTNGPSTLSVILNENGDWRVRGSVTLPGCCGGAADLNQSNDDRKMTRADRRAQFETMTIAEHPWRDIIAAGGRMRIDSIAPTRPVDPASLIDALDAAPPPAGARATSPSFLAAQFCPEFISDWQESACVSRVIAVREGVADYALFAPRFSGQAEVAIFDRETGAYIARGQSAANVYASQDNMNMTTEAREWRRAERRRIAGGARAVPPLLGDAMIGGERHSFAYVDVAPTP
jgi:hypothetical protein